MTDDLAEQLRDIAAEIELRHLQSQIGHPTPLREAANEIERLRAALKETTSMPSLKSTEEEWRRVAKRALEETE